jgi:hypothetical protein
VLSSAEERRFRHVLGTIKVAGDPGLMVTVVAGGGSPRLRPQLGPLVCFVTADTPAGKFECCSQAKRPVDDQAASQKGAAVET